ncbi:mannosyl-oligosaccharide alpha-1,2-mannosidase IA isoform X3 [Drosophila busckii]|uniref:mannosyl-oligosaccharide alpha-1,2-mannosidase IA isoform X3 n=1 Tax=Drosophila busckii TaxID=30019 RepID=UPI00083ECC01|nr:mannosyl-oligosaccharide alpha-1,2-mannosidase IA isoform X3 [Drosophila busckii]XP_033150500.1 mannosyl-oligosaccharide alpha-1,2-mannosidase IA isoform X3 [Drosophila busckii]
MCPKTSKTTPLLLIGGIGFVIVLVAITGVTLINNINLSNIIRLNEKVASDSVSANDNQIKELNYVNNHPKNLQQSPQQSQQLNDTLNAESGEARSLEQIRQEMSSLHSDVNVAEPKLSAVISQSHAPKAQTLDEAPALPFGFVSHTNGSASASASNLIDYSKRAQIVKMMEHAWHNYKLYAWGKNELRPLSQRPHSGSIFGSYDLGATIVDGLDTLYIMGLEKEYKEGRDWIERKFSLDNISAELSVFETNIRFVGGMLTLYAFTGDPLYKEKAQHIADKLLPAFQTPTGIPYALVNTKTGVAKNYGWASGGSSILSEFGTLHLEFAYLSDITGNPLYRERVQTIRQVLKEMEKPKGLYPNFLNPKTGKWGQLHMSLGALGDSYYEYLLKAWLQSGQTDEEAREMYDEAMLAIIDKMVRTSPNGLTYVSDLKFDRLEHKMDHLACFSGGLFALGAATRQSEHTDKYMEVGKGITNTCHESYIRAPTQLGPEAFRFSDAAEARALRSQEKYYILRPETFESYFVLWRLTHDQKYRDWGWDAVQALEKYCRTPHGYCGLRNVYQQDPQKDDVQQSFFLAETLKYLYLLFSDDSVLPLDEWVFNTEAHPLPIKGANIYYRQAPAAQPASNVS